MNDRALAGRIMPLCFIWSVMLILGSTMLLKAIAVTSEGKFMEQPDGLFAFLKNRHMMYLGML